MAVRREAEEHLDSPVARATIAYGGYAPSAMTAIESSLTP